MTVKGYLVFVPFENVASMEYGGLYEPDKATVATVPGHLAGPFEVREIVRSEPRTHSHFGQREGECECPADCDCRTEKA